MSAAVGTVIGPVGGPVCGLGVTKPSGGGGALGGCLVSGSCVDGLLLAWLASNFNSWSWRAMSIGSGGGLASGAFA